MVQDPSMCEVDPSPKVTGELDVWEQNVKNILELSAIWFLAPESKTHLEKDKTRDVFVLHELVMVVTEEGECIR